MNKVIKTPQQELLPQKKTSIFWRKLVKEIIIPLFFILLTLGSVLHLSAPVQAQNVPNDNTAPLGGVVDTIQSIGKETKLPSYQENAHPQSSYEPGASNITSALYYAVDFLKYIMGTIAVVTLIISGVRLVTAGKQIEEVASKQKEHFKYAIIGLVVIIIADPFIKQVFFGEQGEVFRNQSELKAAAERGNDLIRNVYSGYAYFAAAIAILMIVVAGFRMVTAAGNEEVDGKSKKTITYAVVGLVLIGLAELVVKDIVFPRQGTTLPDFEKGKQLIVNITNFISAFLATVSFVMFIYAGYLYVTSFGNEDNPGKAKKVFMGAAIGLLVAMAAYGIVNTVIRFEPVSDMEKAGFNAPPNLPTNP